MKIQSIINPASLARVLLYLMGVLVLLNLGTVYLLAQYGHFGEPPADASNSQKLALHFYGHYVRLFNVDREGNFPSIFSFLNLAISAFLLYIIGKGEKRLTGQHRKWFFLSFIFLFLSIDELFSIHEVLMAPSRLIIRSVMGSRDIGYLHHAWFIPYGLIFLSICLYFLRFIFSLPRRTITLFILSGLIFISGAVGMEMISGKIYSEEEATTSLLYGIMYTIEEAMEMGGVILFIYALLSYLQDHRAPIAAQINLQLEEVTEHPDAQLSPVKTGIVS